MPTSSKERLVLHVFGVGLGCGYGGGYGGGWRRRDEGFDSIYFADGCVGYGGGADFNAYVQGDGYGFGYNYCYMRLVEGE